MGAERIRFDSSGQNIKGTIVTPEKMDNRTPGVIFFHGMTSSEVGYISIAHRLADSGIVGMTLSIRGHGDSEGNFDQLTVKDAVGDGLSAYDFFARYDFVDPKRIGLFGGSVGAATASFVSEVRNVSSLALRVPATYTPEMTKMTYKQLMADEGQIFQRMVAYAKEGV